MRFLFATVSFSRRTRLVRDKRRHVRYTCLGNDALPPLLIAARFREKTSIVSMINIAGSDEETIPFSKPVKATGNIEDWLGAVEKGMQVPHI